MTTINANPALIAISGGRYGKRRKFRASDQERE
jgi:hypothetical protein